MNIIRTILLSKLPYLHFIMGTIVSLLLMIAIRIINLYAFWSIYGEGESASHHPISEFLFVILSLILPITICLFRIYKHMKLKNYPFVKSNALIIIISAVAFLCYSNTLLS
jgi:hypothetical protein